MNRSLSVRSKKDSVTGSSENFAPKHRFTMSTLRGMQQPELSKRMYKIIKSENHVRGAYETAYRERQSIAMQIAEWGEATGDDALSEVSDKLGVLMEAMAQQEEAYAQNLESYRGVLKEIRNTEGNVQPTRDHKQKVSDDIARLKYKEPQSTKLVQLEQELVRAEAQSLVAEAQLTNITRRKFKEAFDINLKATIERAEKQIILAKQARRIVNLLDDTPIVPGDTRPTFDGTEEARLVIDDTEESLGTWVLDVEPIISKAGSLGAGAMPGAQSEVKTVAAEAGSGNGSVGYGFEGDHDIRLQEHPAYRDKSARNRSGSEESHGRIVSGESLGSNYGGEVQPPYPMTEAERRQVAEAGVF